MAFSYSSNANDFVVQLGKIMAYIQEEAGEYERMFVIALNERIMALTPVWEGDSIVNYQWSVDTPLLSHISPVGSGNPGHTNRMALGSEPRRPANEAEVRERLAVVLAAKLPRDIYLTNSAPDIVNLEHGLNPTKKTSRVSEAGMVRLAIIDVVGSLRGK